MGARAGAGRARSSARAAGVAAGACIVMTVAAAPATASVSIRADQASAGEGARGVSFTVERTGALIGADAQVTVALGGTAACPSEVAPCTQTVTVPRQLFGSSAPVDVTLADDDLDEPDETVTASIIGVAGDSVGASSSAAFTLIDDDPTPRVTLAGADVAEGDGAREVRLPVTLSSPSSRPVVVPWSTSGSDAVTSRSGTVTVPAGARSGDIVLTVVGDEVDEPSSSAVVTLSSPSNATLGSPASATLIVGDDDFPRLLADPVAVVEGTGGARTSLPVPVRLSNPSTRTITVPYVPRSGTAILGEDADVAKGVLTFAPGETAKPVELGVVADAVPEPDETLELAVGPAQAAAAPPSGTGPSGPAVAVDVPPLTLTIVDDDAVTVPSQPVPEPQPGPGLQPDPSAAPPASGSSTGNAAVSARPGPRVAISGPRLRGGRVVVTVSCPRTVRACRGSLAVLSVADRTARVRHWRVEHTLAKRVLVLSGGRSATYTFRLTRRTARFLRRASRVRATAFVVVRTADGQVGVTRRTGALGPSS